MSSVPFKITKGQLGFTTTEPTSTDAETAVFADFDDFSCRITNGRVTASSNFDTEEVPGTFCDPATSSTTPSAAAFTLEASVLQDPDVDDVLTGLAAFLWANDSGLTGNPVWFYLGLAEDSPPRAVGQCWITPMDFGGEPRVALTADLSFPIEGRPSLAFGAPAALAAAATGPTDGQSPGSAPDPGDDDPDGDPVDG